MVSKLIRQFLVMVLLDQTGSAFMGGDSGGGAAGDSGGPDNSGGEGGGDSSGNGDAGGSPSGNQGGQPSGDGGSPGSQINYPSDLDQNLHGNPSLSKFYDSEKNEFKVGQLMKSYIHAQKLLGTDKVEIPREGWTQEQTREWLHKVGLPSKIEEYNVSNNLPEGMKANEELFESFKAKAFEVGIMPQHAEALNEWFNGLQADAQKSQLDNYKTQLEEGKSQLKAEFGEAYERKLKAADSVLSSLAKPEQIEALSKKGILDDPDVTRLFINIAEKSGEDKFVDNVSGKGGMTPVEMDRAIGEAHKAMLDPSNPNPRAAEDHYMELIRRKMKAEGKQNIVING